MTNHTLDTIAISTLAHAGHHHDEPETSLGSSVFIVIGLVAATMIILGAVMLIRRSSAEKVAKLPARKNKQ